MRRGDDFTSVKEPDKCAVCGADADSPHLCANHEDEREWGDRFVYEYSHQERNEMSGRTAAHLGVSLHRALEYVPTSHDFSRDMSRLIISIREMRSGVDRDVDCHVCATPHWGQGVAEAAKSLMTLAVCATHEIDVRLLRLTSLEDLILGEPEGTSMSNLLAMWKRQNAAARSAELSASTRGMSIEDVVRKKVGVQA